MNEGSIRAQPFDEHQRDADDAALVARIQAGDHAAFDLLVARFEAPLFRYLCGFVGNPDDARDLAQETFLRAFRSLGTLNDAALLRSWLYRIAHRQACSFLRRMRLWRAFAVRQQGATTHEPDQSLSADVLAALARLPAEQRAPLLLHIVGGFTYDEIAALLGVSEGAVRMRISRGRVAFRQAYNDE